jgi:beta-glucanase (GH16 family)
MIYLRSVPANDFFLNIFYKVRFWFYRNFRKNQLSSQSFRIKDGWNITFEDDFNHVTWGNSENYEKWIIGQGWDPYVPGTNSYPGAPEIVPGTSTAKFTAKYKPAMRPDPTGKEFRVPYEISTISTVLNFKQQFGRFECRCTIPHGRGTWPAFWLWGSTWPPEIDIFEMWGGKDGKKSAVQKADLHYDMHPDGSHGSIPRWTNRIEKESERNWHHFAVEWYPNKIEFFTDGVKIYQYSGKEVLTNFFNVETARMWIVLNNGTDADVLGDYEEDYYTEFFADYVRAYKKQL